MPDKEDSNVRRIEILNEIDHNSLVPLHNEAFIRIDKRLEDLEESDYDHATALSGILTSIDFIHKRLDQRETQTDAILQLGYSVQNMVTEVAKLSDKMEKFATSLGDHENRIVGIEKDDLKDELKLIKDELLLIKNRPANVLMSYLDYVLKGGFVVAFLSYLYWLSGGRIGGNP